VEDKPDRWAPPVCERERERERRRALADRVGRKREQGRGWKKK
jgi:hypothetical protein